MEKEKEKDTMKGSEDLKPTDDQVLLEDNDDEIKVYMNTWKNYNEYGADLVLYDNIDGWMSVDDAIEFCEEHEEDEPFINDTENVPFEVSEYDVAYKVLETLQEYESLDDYDKKMIGIILSTGDYNFEEAVELCDNGGYRWYDDVVEYEDLGYAIVDEFGSPFEATQYASNYIDEDKLRRDLSLDVRDMYYDTAEQEVDYEHRFDDPDSFDRDAEIEQWLDDHEEELLDELVDEVLSGGLGDDIIENYFDYEKFGRDVSFDGTFYFLDGGALEITY